MAETTPYPRSYSQIAIPLANMIHISGTEHTDGDNIYKVSSTKSGARHRNCIMIFRRCVDQASAQGIGTIKPNVVGGYESGTSWHNSRGRGSDQ